MARTIQAFCDERGQLHENPVDATVADIAAALGRVGDEGGLTNGVAKLILQKRAAIERAFADYDLLSELAAKPAEILDMPERKRA